MLWAFPIQLLWLRDRYSWLPPALACLADSPIPLPPCIARVPSTSGRALRQRRPGTARIRPVPVCPLPSQNAVVSQPHHHSEKQGRKARREHQNCPGVSQLPVAGSLGLLPTDLDRCTPLLSRNMHNIRLDRASGPRVRSQPLCRRIPVRYNLGLG